MNKKLKFGHNVHNSKTHSMMSKSFEYLNAFFCNLRNEKKGGKILVFVIGRLYKEILSLDQ